MSKGAVQPPLLPWSSDRGEQRFTAEDRRARLLTLRDDADLLRRDRPEHVEQHPDHPEVRRRLVRRLDQLLHPLVRGRGGRLEPHREQRHRATVDSSDARVRWWSLFVSATVLLAAVLALVASAADAQPAVIYELGIENLQLSPASTRRWSDSTPPDSVTGRSTTNAPG